MENHLIIAITSYNPNIIRFKNVLSNAYNVADEVFLVDNKSTNYADISDLIKNIDIQKKIKFFPLNQNKGLGNALNQAINHIEPKEDNIFILTLDQDSIILINRKMIDNIISEGYKFIGNTFGAILLASKEDTDKKLIEKIDLALIGGLIINFSLFKEGLRYREEFFLDQIDFDLSYNIRSRGKNILRYNAKTLDHIVGIRIKTTRIRLAYEPEYRIYLITRNSLVLLREKKINIYFFIRQLLIWYTVSFILNHSKNILTLLKIFFVATNDGINEDYTNNFKFR